MKWSWKIGRLAGEGGRDLVVASLMEPDPATVPRSIGLSKALLVLQKAPDRCVLVVDDAEHLVGMLTVDAVGELVAVRDAVRKHDGRSPIVSALASTPAVSAS